MLCYYSIVLENIGLSFAMHFAMRFAMRSEKALTECALTLMLTPCLPARNRRKYMDKV